MWAWLVAEGIYRDIVAAFVSALILVPIMRIAGSQFAKKVATEVVKAAKAAEHDVITAYHDAEKELGNARSD